MIRKRKTRSRKLYRSVSKPESRYRSPIASDSSSTNSTSESVQERLGRIENNYQLLDQIWADIESRIELGDETWPIIHNKPR